MKKTIFIKFSLILLPIVLLLNAAILVFIYEFTYYYAFDSNTKHVQEAAKIGAELLKCNYPDSQKDVQAVSNSFTSLCNILDAKYMYAVNIDVERSTEQYFVLGFGKDASEEAKKSRYPGYVVNGTLNPDLIAVYNGDDSGVIRHESNQFGNTLICYLPLTEYTTKDAQTGKTNTVKLENPLIIGAEIDISIVVTEFQNNFFKLAALTIIVTFLIIFTFDMLLYFRVSRPIKKISGRMNSFVSDRDKEFEKLPIKGTDELSEMSNSFNIMAGGIDTYIKDIEKLTKEKHTRDAELNIAHKIQEGLLEPPSFRNQNFEVNAYILAARDIGGDLYDYTILDDGRIYIAIADVSGKGISAALFMSRAITLLKQYARLGYSPAQILAVFNNTLAAQNPNNLFITAFVALYNPETNELIYSNAGHNYPYIISDKLIELDGAKGTAAGIFPNLEYDEISLTLKDGDVVFMYTDGVVEAENNQGSFFGDEALKDELRVHIGADTDNIISDVLNKIHTFVDGAPQSDDTTIITMKVLPKPLHRELCVPAKAENLVALDDMITNDSAIPEELKYNLNLIAEEMFINICSYAYPDKTSEATVKLDISPETVTITFIDSGKPFDPTKQLLNIEDYDYEHSVGGLGRFVTFSLADEYSYIYKDNKNILRITLKTGESD